jgi:hypothetical protein
MLALAAALLAAAAAGAGRAEVNPGDMYSQMPDAVDDVEHAVGDLSARLDEVEESVKSSQKQAVATANAFNQNKQWVNKNLNTIKANADSIERIQQIQGQMKAWLAKNEDAISANAAKLDEQKAFMEQNRVWVQENLIAVEQNKKMISQLAADTAALQDWVDNNKDGIKSNRAWIQKNAAGIRENQMLIERNREVLNSTQDFVEQNRDWISKNMNAIEQNKQVLEHHELVLEKVEKWVDENKKAIEANREWIAENKAGVAKNTQLIQANKDFLLKHEKYIEQNLQAIEVNKASIATLGSRLTTIGEWLEKNKKGIEDNTKYIKQNKKFVEDNQVWIRQNVRSIEKNNGTIAALEVQSSTVKSQAEHDHELVSNLFGLLRQVSAKLDRLQMAMPPGGTAQDPAPAPAAEAAAPAEEAPDTETPIAPPMPDVDHDLRKRFDALGEALDDPVHHSLAHKSRHAVTPDVDAPSRRVGKAFRGLRGEPNRQQRAPHSHPVRRTPADETGAPNLPPVRGDVQPSLRGPSLVATDVSPDAIDRLADFSDDDVLDAVDASEDA